MEYRCKVTVLDKKLFPELQARYCAVPDSGKCPCYNVGDEFIFYRNDQALSSSFFLSSSSVSRQLPSLS